MALSQTREVEVGIAISHGGDCGEWTICALPIPADTPAANVEAAARQVALHLLEAAHSDDMVTGIWLYHDPGPEVADED